MTVTQILDFFNNQSIDELLQCILDGKTQCTLKPKDPHPFILLYEACSHNMEIYKETLNALSYSFITSVTPLGISEFKVTISESCHSQNTPSIKPLLDDPGLLRRINALRYVGCHEIKISIETCEYSSEQLLTQKYKETLNATRIYVHNNHLCIEFI